VRDPSGQRDAQAFRCADLDLEPTAILQRFVCRWRIETTFQELKGTSGRRDATAMVGPGHPAHDTGTALTLLAGEHLGTWIDARTQHCCPPPSSRLVQ
jgi:hypothetical protein